MVYTKQAEFETILKGLGRSKNTIRSYHNDLSKLLPMISSYSDSELQSAILSLSRKGYSPATLKRMLSSFKTYCNVFEIKVNFSKVGSPKIPQRQSPYITDGIFSEGLTNILNDTKRTVYSSTFKCAVFDILYKTGVRVGELLTLSVDSYDKESGYIQTIGKGNKQRKIPVHKSIQRVVQDEAFISTLNNLSKSTITFWIKKYFGADFSPHSFRHGFTTKIIKNGANAKAVKSVLGHESYTTTLRYFHMNFDEIKNSVMSALDQEVG